MKILFKINDDSRETKKKDGILRVAVVGFRLGFHFLKELSKMNLHLGIYVE